MIDYSKFENDENFMAILDYLRCESLADELKVAETLDMDIEIVNKHYSTALAVASEEIANGKTTNYDSDVALGFMNYLGKI